MIYTKSRLKIFLSYSKVDVEYARKIYKELSAYNIEIWFDEEKLIGGEKWKSAIHTAIANSRYFILLLSSNSVSKRGFLNVEVKKAISILEEYPQMEIYLIPIRLDNCSPQHSQLQDLQYIDMFPEWEKGLYRLLVTMKINKDQDHIKSITDITICPHCGQSNLKLIQRRRVELKAWVLHCKNCSWEAFDSREDLPAEEMLKLVSRFGNWKFERI